MTDIASLRTSIADAVAARLSDVKTASMTENNKKKLTHCVQASLDEKVAELLVACNFDASYIAANVYSVEKVFDIVAYAARAARMSIYCNATFDSLLALETANVACTRDVIATLCTNDVKTKYDAKIKSTRVQTAKSQSTVATQHNSTINAFLALHMFNVTRDANNDEVFTLNRENAAIRAIAERKNVKLVSDDAEQSAEQSA